MTGREGETRRRTRRREGETRHSVGGRGGGGGAPDLDLDQDLVVEQEEDEAVRRRRSRTVRQKQREPGSRSRSSPRSSSPSWDSSPPGEGVEPGGAGRERRRKNEKKNRRRAEEEEEEEERDGSPTHNAKASGSSRASAQRSAFSFLRPMTQEPRPLSDSESAASFSEVSLSAASIATAGRREEPDWMRAESSDDDSGAPPGPWLKPSPQRLSQVLIGSHRSGQGIVGGLSI